MYQTLCRAYRDPDRPRKKKQAYKPSKVVMIDNYEAGFITHHYNLKGWQVSNKKSRKMAFKEAENWI